MTFSRQMTYSQLNEIIEKFSRIDLEEIVFNNEEEIDDIVSFIKDKDHELEVRFGSFGSKFLPEVDLVTFLRLNKFLSSFAVCKAIEYNYITVFDNKKKMIKVLKPPVNDSFAYLENDHSNVINEIVMLKKRSGCSDNHEYNFRVVLSTETLLETGDEIYKSLPTFFKTRKRIVYSWNNMEIHLSMFKESDKVETLKESEIIYDVEIEITNQNDTGIVINFIKTILSVIQNTERIISNKDLEILKSVYDSIFKFENDKSRRFTGVQPVSLKFDLNGLINWKNYAMTMKLDGERRLLLVHSRNLILINSKMEFSVLNFKLPNNTFDGYIFDLELFRGELYVFDLLAMNYICVRNDPNFKLENRVEIVKNFVENSGYEKLKCKSYVFENVIQNATKAIRDNFYDNCSIFDGIIFVPSNSEYNCPPLKWKPESLLTIDFKIFKSGNLGDQVSWELYSYDKNGDTLFTYPNYDQIHTIYVDKKISDIYEDNSVVEFLFDKETEQFKPLKSRYDKVKGNHIKIAQDVFGTIIYPYNFNWADRCVSHEDLYFFRFQRFKNYIRRILISNCAVKGTRLLDLNCSNGEDLYKYVDANIKYVYGFTENVKVCEGVYGKIISDPTSKNFTMTFSNVGEPGTILETDGETYDLITFFDGIHKYFDSKKLFETFPKNLDCLVSGGYLILTVMDNDYLDGKMYKVDTDTFSINPVKIARSQFKRMLTIKKGNYANNLQLSDTQAVKLLLSRKGFELVDEKSFIEFYNEWKFNGNYLSNPEKEYSKCYKALVFRKK